MADAADTPETERRPRAARWPASTPFAILPSRASASPTCRRRSPAGNGADDEAYAAALRAGWTREELKMLNFDGPTGKPARTRRPQAPRTAHSVIGEEGEGTPDDASPIDATVTPVAPGAAFVAAQVKPGPSRT